MKKTVNTLRHMALAMTAALMAAACADETPVPGGGADEGQPATDDQHLCRHQLPQLGAPGRGQESHRAA